MRKASGFSSMSSMFSMLRLIGVFVTSVRVDSVGAQLEFLLCRNNVVLEKSLELFMCKYNIRGELGFRIEKKGRVFRFLDELIPHIFVEHPRGAALTLLFICLKLVFWLDVLDK